MSKVRGRRRSHFGQRVQEVEDRASKGVATNDDMQFLIECADALGLVWSSMENITNEFYMEDTERSYKTDVETIRGMVRSFDTERDLIYKRVISQS